MYHRVPTFTIDGESISDEFPSWSPWRCTPSGKSVTEPPPIATFWCAATCERSWKLSDQTPLAAEAGNAESTTQSARLAEVVTRVLRPAKHPPIHLVCRLLLEKKKLRRARPGAVLQTRA